MKTTLSLILSILFVLLALVPTALAQYQDYMQFGLPKGAKARLGKGDTTEIVYSPDSTRLAGASSIGIWIYDAQTGEELDLLVGHTSRVNRVAFSPDGQTLASASDDRTIRLWNVNTGHTIHTLTGHTKWIHSIIFSPDGQTLASASDDQTIRLWNMNTGHSIHTLTGHTKWIHSIIFSPDGQTLASASDDDTIRLWDVDTGRHIRTLIGTVFGIAFSPNRNTLASAHWDGIRLWDVNTGRRIRTLTGHTDLVDNVIFSPDGQTLASGGNDQTIRLWDVNTGYSIHTLTGHTDSVYNVAFSPDGQTLASGGNDQTIRLWDVNTGYSIHTLTGHTDLVYSVIFSPDGQTLASASWDDTIRFWDVNTGRHIRTLIGHTYIHHHTSRVNRVAFSPDGQTLASASNDQTIRLWDVNTGRHIRTLTAHSVAFSPDGQTLAGANAEEIHLWDVNTGRRIRTFTEHTDSVYNVAFSPDGRTLASGGDDGTIRLWDVDTGHPIHTLTGHTNSAVGSAFYRDLPSLILPIGISTVSSVIFSPDGQTLASGGHDHTIRLWDVDTGHHLRTLTGHTFPVNKVAFSPDGQTLASASDDGTIRFWDVNTGRHIRTLTAHTNSVNSVSFSPDGRTLASGSADGTVLLWELVPSTTTNAVVSLSPASVRSPDIGKQLTLSLKIADTQNVAGYQATVSYDPTALRYVESANGDYLPSGAFFIPPVAEGDTVTLAASSLAGESSGDGTLATLTFEVVAVKASTVRLTNVLLTDSTGSSSNPKIENAEITEPPQLIEDVNKDGIVNIIDLTLVASNFGKTGENDADVNSDGIVNIIDLTLVAAAFGNTASAPEVWSRDLEITPTKKQVEQWLHQAKRMNLTDPTFQRGLLMLQQLLATLTPKETVLLPNYPNPFNPETWIPYQLAESADVSISIYAANGKLVRMLDLGYQPVGIYDARSRAAYWDGRNVLGEPVVSGVYFYTLTADDFTATRKMLILK